ncbi:SDR family NAD(P)-dependent oxidoreductase [Streptacidiphilus sp. EB103A]|uniref:SDR family NAD(P)-dependent oxidoreductase n=1 Tax=Streptacidiphilus sp. EB103A TaxID=3156275 RepID=UPI0035147180
MRDFTAQRALVTGASSGIGEAFAVELAGLGADLVLVARSHDRLDALAERLERESGVSVEVIACDLAAPGAGERLAAEVAGRGLRIDVLVNNAGFAMHGLFPYADPARVAEQIALNTAAVADLTGRFLPAMVERRHGAVVNISSTAGFQPLPYMAVYGATKAFVLSFSEALWAEVRPMGVDVLALCPGATQTSFFDVVGAEEASFGRRQTSQQVVRAGLRALAKRRPSVVSGTANSALAKLPRLLTRAAMARVTARTLRPRAQG